MAGKKEDPRTPFCILFQVQRQLQSLCKLLLGNVKARVLPTWPVPNQLVRVYIQALHILTKGRPDLNTPEFWESLDAKAHGPGPLLLAAKCPVLISLKTTAKLLENNLLLASQLPITFLTTSALIFTIIPD